MDLSQQIGGAVRSEYLAGHCNKGIDRTPASSGAGGSAYPSIERYGPLSACAGRRDSAHFAKVLLGSSAGFT
jgi:hypothetical protein